MGVSGTKPQPPTPNSQPVLLAFFGTGAYQAMLSGEGGAFRLTIARWLTPDKHWIHGQGITPDITVALPDPLPAGTDPTLDKALDLLDSAAFRQGLRAAA